MKGKVHLVKESSMTKIPTAPKSASHAARRPKRIGFSVETVKTAQVRSVPNLEVDQKDA